MSGKMLERALRLLRRVCASALALSLVLPLRLAAEQIDPRFAELHQMVLVGQLDPINSLLIQHEGTLLHETYYLRDQETQISRPEARVLGIPKPPSFRESRASRGTAHWMSSFGPWGTAHWMSSFGPSGKPL